MFLIISIPIAIPKYSPNLVLLVVLAQHADVKDIKPTRLILTILIHTHTTRLGLTPINRQAITLVNGSHPLPHARYARPPRTFT